MKFKLCMGAWLLLMGGFCSCQKNEELDKLDIDYRVVTDYDPDTDFGSFQFYYLPDCILFIGQNERAQYLDSLQAKPIGYWYFPHQVSFSVSSGSFGVFINLSTRSD